MKEWKDRKKEIEEQGYNLYMVQNGYVGNAVAWWGLGNRGYVTDINKAQVYTKEEILASSWREQDIIWPKLVVEKAVIEIVDGQYLDHSKKV